MRRAYSDMYWANWFSAVLIFSPLRCAAMPPLKMHYFGCSRRATAFFESDENLERASEMRAKFFAAIAEFDICLSGSQFLAELQTFLITNKGHTLLAAENIEQSPIIDRR